MKILLADSGPTMRGGQWQTLYLAQGLAEAGGDVRLLARAGSPVSVKAMEQGFAPEDATAGNMRALAKWADVVHVQDARSHSVAALWARRPIVVSRRVAFPIGRSPASRWKYGRATAFIAVSKYVAGILEKAGVPPTKISVVHDGVPRPAEAPLALDKRPIPLLGLRTGDPAKGDDLLVAGARLAGIDVHWTDNIAADLPLSYAFAYITRHEGLGSAALLAMANGTAVLASRTGGLEEIVEDGVTGLLTENDPKAIAAAIRRVIDDPALAHRLVETARKRVLAHHSVERMVHETVEVYRKVVS